MTTISVPLPANLLKALEDFIRDGGASNKAEVMRRALKIYLDEQLVQEILRASKGPTLRGDLRTLARRLRK